MSRRKKPVDINEIKRKYGLTDDDVKFMNKNLNYDWAEEIGKIFLTLKIIGFKKTEIIAYSPFLKDKLSSRKDWEDFFNFKKVLGDNPELIIKALKAGISAQEIKNNPEKFTEKNINIILNIKNL